MGEADDERRGGDRIPINDEFARLDPSASSSTWVSDLSLGGVFVHTQALLPVGSMIELRFTILVDDPVVIEAFGKVVRHSRKPRGMGVAFAAISPDMTQRIEEVLAHQRPLDSGAPLRLPEPRRAAPDKGEAPTPKRAGLSEQERVVFARPAPVQGLGLRRVRKQDFENAVTAAFPRVKARIADDDADDTTTVFEPPPFKVPPRPPNLASKLAPGPPKVTRKAPNEDDLTRPFPTLRRKDD